VPSLPYPIHFCHFSSFPSSILIIVNILSKESNKPLSVCGSGQGPAPNGFLYAKSPKVRFYVWYILSLQFNNAVAKGSTFWHDGAKLGAVVFGQLLRNDQTNGPHSVRHVCVENVADSLQCIWSYGASFLRFYLPRLHLYIKI